MSCRSLWWVPCLAVWLACSAKEAPPVAQSAPSPMAEMEADVARASTAGALGSAAPRAPSRTRAATDGEGAVVADDSATDQPRMVHYSGYARLRVTREHETADALTALAEGAGGRVERLTSRRIVLRVPAEQFDEVFEAVLEAGDVLDRSIQAKDVTEAYTSVELRLRTAERTRDRLADLLARAEGEKERLTLLQEIQRVTERIDRMERQVRVLSELATLARITVEWVPRDQVARRADRPEVAELAWIRRLSPFDRKVAEEAAPLRLPVPYGMVALSPRGHLVVEAADGSRMWTARRVNRPRAGADFWQTALTDRLAEDFASTDEEQVGEWRVIRFTSRGDEPYTWWVGIRAQGADLDLVEAYFPNLEHEARHEGAVREVLRQGRS